MDMNCGLIPPKSPKTRPQHSTDVVQAREIQRICLKAVRDLDGIVERAADDEAKARGAAALKNAVAAWNMARDAARIARNRPLPGSLRPESGGGPRRLKVLRQSFSEPGAASEIARKPAQLPAQLPAPLDKPITNVT